MARLPADGYTGSLEGQPAVGRQLCRRALQENLNATPTRTRPLALRTGYDARARGAISGRLNAAGWRPPERRHERPDGYRRTGLVSFDRASSTQAVSHTHGP